MPIKTKRIEVTETKPVSFAVCSWCGKEIEASLLSCESGWLAIRIWPADPFPTSTDNASVGSPFDDPPIGEYCSLGCLAAATMKVNTEQRTQE